MFAQDHLTCTQRNRLRACCIMWVLACTQRVCTGPFDVHAAQQIESMLHHVGACMHAASLHWTILLRGYMYRTKHRNGICRITLFQRFIGIQVCIHVTHLTCTQRNRLRACCRQQAKVAHRKRFSVRLSSIQTYLRYLQSSSFSFFSLITVGMGFVCPISTVSSLLFLLLPPKRFSLDKTHTHTHNTHTHAQKHKHTHTRSGVRKAIHPKVPPYRKYTSSASTLSPPAINETTNGNRRNNKTTKQQPVPLHCLPRQKSTKHTSSASTLTPQVDETTNSNRRNNKTTTVSPGN